MDGNTNESTFFDYTADLPCMAIQPQSSPLEERAAVSSKSAPSQPAANETAQEEGQEPPAGQPEDLPQQLISYIVTPERLLHCADWRVWKEFRSSPSNPDDWSFVLLRNQFNDGILPHIYDYPMSENKRKQLEVLGFHPNFMRTPRGYKLKEPEQRVAYERQPKLQQDYRILKPGQPTYCVEDANASKRIFLEPHVSDDCLHTIVTPADFRLPNSGNQFQFTPRTGALLSACLSEDRELFGCSTLDPDEMRRRLRKAKTNFEDKAAMPENVRSAEKLQDKLKEYMEIKRAMIDLTSRCLADLSTPPAE